MGLAKLMLGACGALGRSGYKISPIELSRYSESEYKNVSLRSNLGGVVTPLASLRPLSLLSIPKDICSE